MKNKKVVAKEGLIFLCVFFVMISAVKLDDPAAAATLLAFVFFPLVLGYALYLMIRLQIIGNSVFPLNYAGRALKEVLILGLPFIFIALSFLTMGIFSNDSLMRELSPEVQIATAILLTFIIIVPFYVIRFVIWAIKALRKK